MYDDESSCFLQQGKETQLLHVFEEDLIIGSERTEDVQETPHSAHSGIYARDFYATLCNSFLLALRKWCWSIAVLVFAVSF